VLLVANLSVLGETLDVRVRREQELNDLSNMFGPILRGGANYYGRFYPTALKPQPRPVRHRRPRKHRPSITNIKRTIRRLHDRANKHDSRSVRLREAGVVKLH